MAQVITPPSIGIGEQQSKDWYRAEALRKVKGELVNIYQDIENEPARREVKIAMDSIEAARMHLDPRLRPIPKRVRTR